MFEFEFPTNYTLRQTCQKFRREFMSLLGGATSWPLVARAQQGECIRRIGAIMAIEEDDPQTQRRLAALHRGLQQLGWGRRP